MRRVGSLETLPSMVLDLLLMNLPLMKVVGPMILWDRDLVDYVIHVSYNLL